MTGSFSGKPMMLVMAWKGWCVHETTMAHQTTVVQARGYVDRGCNRRAKRAVPCLRCGACSPGMQPPHGWNRNLINTSELTFAEHVHGFIALDGPLRRGEGPKPQPGLTRRLTNRRSFLVCYSNICIAWAGKFPGAFYRVERPQRPEGGRGSCPR